MTVLSAVLLVTGVSLFLVAGIGLQRFDDVFARLHVVTKPATLGLVLVLCGAAVRLASIGATAKLLLVVLLQFLTAPLGAHLVGRAAHRSATLIADSTEFDDLARAREEHHG
jgi:multicomponent Na+:H+ antiporter subunit G